MKIKLKQQHAAGVFSKFSTDRVILWTFGILSCVFLLLALGRPFPTDDLFLYSMIGRAIYVKGMLPFTFAFDHKPIATYYFYGLYTQLLPDNVPKYQLLSVAVYALSAVLTRAIARQGSWLLHFMVIMALAIRYLGFTANTQLIFTPLALISIYLVFRAKSHTEIFLGGVLAAVVFNLNYSAALVVGPGVLYALFTSLEHRSRQLLNLATYAAGFALGFAALLAPLLIKDPTLIGHYFGAQRTFLNSYNKWETVHIVSFLISAGLLCALLLFCLPCKEEDRRLRNALLITFVFSLVSTIPSGKFYAYYLYPLVLPVTVIYFTSTSIYKQAALLAVVCILALCSVKSNFVDFGNTRDVRAAYDLKPFRQLKAIVGENLVLTIRAHPAIIYFADIHPAQPLVWTNHAEIIYGAKEDDYFLRHLQPSPLYVLTMESLCANQKDNKFYPKTCAAISLGYTEIARVADPLYWKRAILYKRKAT